MDRAIIKNWNSVVSDGDLVYVLGDFSFKGRNAEHYLDQLNGEIVLIKGNHDKFIKHKKIIMVRDYLEIEQNGVKYVLSHYPICSWNGCFRGSVLLYGHVHSTGQDWEFVKHKNAHNMCLEFHDYKPIELRTIKSI